LVCPLVLADVLHLIVNLLLTRFESSLYDSMEYYILPSFKKRALHSHGNSLSLQTVYYILQVYKVQSWSENWESIDKDIPTIPVWNIDLHLFDY